jgi:3'(2'), 5'-bisphosphate nucleotidase
MISRVNLEGVVNLARQAGNAIMEYYALGLEVSLKDDESPLTKADLISNEIIVNRLREIYPSIPIVSEEGFIPDYSIRKNWKYFWLIDPLDGTKEFINRTNEFTVNIALICEGKPVLGVVFAPALKLMYFAKSRYGAFKESVVGDKVIRRKLPNVSPFFGDRLVVVGSRYHMNSETQYYLDALMKEIAQIEFKSVGSSLKACLIAEQEADLYPRFGPTMEWDTAAAHAICCEVGANFLSVSNGQFTKLSYNKVSLINESFLVSR